MNNTALNPIAMYGCKALYMIFQYAGEEHFVEGLWTSN
jgi:hypothetical protein